MNQRWIVFLSAVLATSIIATGFGLAVDRAVGTTASTPHLRTVPSATLASQGVSRSPYSMPAYCGLEQAAVSRGGLTNPKLACPLSPAAAEAAATRAEGGHPVESLLARISTGPPTSLHAHPVWLVVVGGGTLAMSVRVIVLDSSSGQFLDVIGTVPGTWVPPAPAPGPPD